MGNRDALLEAAVVCLREQGYGGTRARDLAGTAGVSLGAIRYHFGSTEALLNEAIAESSRRWIAGFRASLTARATRPEDGLLAAADHLYDEFSAYRHLLVGFVEAFARAQRSAPIRDQLAGHYAQFRQSIGELLETGFGTGTRGDKTAASLLIALVDGLMVQWLLDPTTLIDPAALRRAVLALVTAAIPTDR